MIQKYLEKTKEYSTFRLFFEITVLTLIAVNLTYEVGVAFNWFPKVEINKENTFQVLLASITWGPLFETFLCQLLPFWVMKKSSKSHPIFFAVLTGFIFSFGHYETYKLACIAVFPGGFLFSWQFIIMVNKKYGILRSFILTTLSHIFVNGISYLLWLM